MDKVVNHNPKPGDLVEVSATLDHDRFYFTKLTHRKLGIVIEHVQSNSSPNIWKVLVEDCYCDVHVFDMF